MFEYQQVVYLALSPTIHGLYNIYYDLIIECLMMCACKILPWKHSMYICLYYTCPSLANQIAEFDIII